MKDKLTKETFGPAERERLLRGFLPGALLGNGLYCRPDERGEPCLQFAPALIAGPAEFDEIESTLRKILTEAQTLF